MDPEILVSVKNKVQVVTLNRPNKRNAITGSMYKALTNILRDAAVDDEIMVTVLTGKGDYYSSGNDLYNMGSANSEDPIREAKASLFAFVDAFINFPKILIAIMNGPAIGIAATTLALCDIVYASEKAFLQTPFIRLGLSPEGCSTYTFPRVFGTSKATEMLLLGHKMTSLEALKHGFVSEIYSSNEMLEKIWNKIYGLTSLPKDSLLHSKRLLKMFDKDSLVLANVKECDELEFRWQSEEFQNAVLNFISSKTSKL
ncbi:enoyl-CoA delta isomerase 2-like [Arctopsyche grandis]|uniref:enoyl-CoA delta isomerase 2-like n=1 Tax=Arctopsyche grandis TaxID=121162 RepID=UPI00406D90EF